MSIEIKKNPIPGYDFAAIVAAYRKLDPLELLFIRIPEEEKKKSYNTHSCLLRRIRQAFTRRSIKEVSLRYLREEGVLIIGKKKKLEFQVVKV